MRAQLLKPIADEIKTEEAKLAKLEKEQNKGEKKLAEGDHSPELIKTLGLQKKEIELLEAKLYHLYEEYETKKESL